MIKQSRRATKRLALARETLSNLDTHELEGARGAFGMVTIGASGWKWGCGDKNLCIPAGPARHPI
jgi:hypothetical protein